jgi:ABC-type amino acid transport substrate-binding protein
MNKPGLWPPLVIAGFLLIIFIVLAGCTSPKGDTPIPSACPTEKILFLTEDLYPFNYIGNDGTLQGQSVEIIKDLQRRLNCSSRIEVHPWNVAYETALGSPGTAVFSTVRDKEREDRFRWVGPIGSFEYTLFARNDSGIHLESLEAARNAGPIAVVEGDARHTYLAERNFSNIQTYLTDDGCLYALLNQSVSLWIGSSATTPETLKRLAIPEGTIVPVYTLIRTDLYIAFNNRTAQSTVRAYQGALDAMKADGTFARITGTGIPAHPFTIPAGDRVTFASSTLLPGFTALVSARMHGIAAAMETLAITGELKGGNWESIRPLLVRIEREYPEARFWYARPDGSYYTTVDNLTSANLRDRSYFQGVLAGETSIGTIVVSKSTGKYSAIIAVPVRDQEMVNGLLGASVSCDTLEESIFNDFQLPGGYYAFAVDSEGMPVLDSLPGRIFSLEGLPGTKNQMRASLEGVIAYQYEGALHKAIFRTEDVTGWKLAIGWRE